MKPKKYIEKYELNVNDKFNHSEFVQDLTFDFISLLEIGKARENIKGYENAIRAIRMKWDAINNKTVGQLPDKLWGYFYASVIATMREELFPEIMEHRIKGAEERRKRRDSFREREQWEEGFWFSFLHDLLIQRKAPIESFRSLGLTDKANEEDIKYAYRKLSFEHHPDKGGNKEKFIQATEAKNRCLAYINQNIN